MAVTPRSEITLRADLPADTRAALLALAEPRVACGGPWSPQHPHPKQQAFLTLQGREGLYGGSAGPGKSSALLMAALQYVCVPGYSALILRRSVPELEGEDGLIERAKDWLSPWVASGAVRWSARRNRFAWPSGASMTLGHLMHENDRFRYQGLAYQYCAVPDEPVLLADGTSAQLGLISVGDVVATTDGPRPVEWCGPVGLKDGVTVSTSRGRMVVGSGHRLLTAGGDWVSLAVLMSRSPRRAVPKTSTSVAQRSATRKPLELRRLGRSPMLEPSRLSPDQAPLQEIDASTASDRTGCASSERKYREPSQRRLWFVQLRQTSLPSLSPEPSSAVECPQHECARVLSESGRADCWGGCSTGCRLRGEPPRETQADDSTSPQQQDGAAIRSRSWWRSGGRLCTRTRTRQAARLHCHPYTMELRAGNTADGPTTWACIAPTGDRRRMWDLRVAGASSWVSASTGLYSANCGFDELTQWPSAKGYLYVGFSRVRRRGPVCQCGQPLSRASISAPWRHVGQGCKRPSPVPGSIPAACLGCGYTIADVPLRTRAATNPGGHGHSWVRARFVGRQSTPRRWFLPATIEDNPSLDAETYIQSLAELDPVERARLIRGDWNATAEGQMFSRAWFLDPC